MSAPSENPQRFPGSGPRPAAAPSGPDAPTLPTPPGDTHATQTSPAPAGAADSTPSSFDHGRFLPGTILAERYRIVELLGQGGMGEVYRVDDLRLGQTVALKFLTEARAADAGGLTALCNEVRTARLVAHPNVCRVYDVGELDGLPFISMEYVDGEHLHSLLRRIGRLPEDKAVELARQLCHGLAAIHQQGLLHRDLKPTNVMVDGRGQARITDFGLAGAARDFAPGSSRAGTPAYMAPEQINGRGVSVLSDVYALGLVLYELFTGHRVFEAASWTEFVHLHENHIPRSPALLVDELDPAIERIILQCLEKDPQRRPPSALAVAAALPGADPLAAALAAGQTPTPEMVAATRSTAGLAPRTGLACVATIAVGLLLVAFVSDRASLLRKVPLEYSAPVLVERARAIAREIGYGDRPVDSASGFFPDRDLFEHLRATDARPDRWEHLAEQQLPAIGFWYRQSPQRLEPQNIDNRVRPEDPPPLISGMWHAYLASDGRLQWFEAVPPQLEPGAEPNRPAPRTESPARPAGPPVASPWDRLFDYAGLNLSEFDAVEPRWLPTAFSDARYAWKDAHGLRVEAAEFEGRPTWFAVIRPWTRPERMPESSASEDSRAEPLIIALLFILLGAGGVLTWRNVRLGRGDRRGAGRVALYLLAVGVVGRLMSAQHAARPGDLIEAVIRAIGPAGFYAGSFWLMYMALEPTVRRRWPHRLVTWTRVLNGHLRDPLVGRDVLLGTLCGVATAAVEPLRYVLSRALGIAPNSVLGFGGVAELTLRETVTGVLHAQPLAVFNGMIFLFFPLLIYIVVRRAWLAALLALLVWTVLFTLREGGASPAALALSVVISLLLAAIWTTLALRFGLLTITVQFFVMFVLGHLPLTLDLSAWYATAANTGGLIVLAIALAAFTTARAGGPLVRTSLLEA